MKLTILSIIILLASCTSPQRDPSSVKSVLYIGDSQSEGFLGGITFEHLKEVSKVDEIRLFGVGSSSPRHWGDKNSSKNAKWLCKRKGRFNKSSGVSIKDHACKGSGNASAFSRLNSNKSDLVVFQFLGNSMGFNENYIIKKVSQLLEELDGSQQCLFITSPPYYKDLVEKNKLRMLTQSYFIKAIGSRCKTVAGVSEESLNTYAQHREYYSGDRIHLSKKGAQVFFAQIKPLLP